MTQDYSNAQVAFDNQTNWAIIAPYNRWTARQADQPLPVVSCPIVSTANITSDTLCREAIQAHISPAGVKDLDSLLEKLQKIGAVVSYPVAIPQISPTPVNATVEA